MQKRAATIIKDLADSQDTVLQAQLVEQEPALKILIRNHGKPLVHASTIFTSALVIQDDKLIMVSPTCDTQSCSPGSTGDIVINAGRCLMFLSELSNYKHYRPRFLCNNTSNMGFQLSLILPDAYKLQRYFERF